MEFFPFVKWKWLASVALWHHWLHLFTKFIFFRISQNCRNSARSRWYNFVGTINLHILHTLPDVWKYLFRLKTTVNQSETYSHSILYTTPQFIQETILHIEVFFFIIIIEKCRSDTQTKRKISNRFKKKKNPHSLVSLSVPNSFNSFGKMSYFDYFRNEKNKYTEFLTKIYFFFKFTLYA